MHVHRILIALLTGISIGTSNAQPTFQQTFGPLVTTSPFPISYVIRHDNGAWTMRGGFGLNTLLRLNANGTPDWMKAFTSPDLASGSMITATGSGPSNSTIIALGDTVESLGPALSRRTFGVARIAASGSVVWSKRYRFEVPEDLNYPSDDHQLALATDGSFFLDGGEPSRASIMRFESNGDLDWARALTDPDGLGHIDELIVDGNGGCYFLGGYTSEFQDTSMIIAGHLNSNGALLWSRKFDPADPSRIFQPLHLLRSQNGDIVITALEYGGGSPNNGLLMRLTSTGNLLWAKQYWFNSSETLSIKNTVERSDGQFWMALNKSGSGIARLNAQGVVQEAERITYEIMGNSIVVVEWEPRLMHNDEIGVTGLYLIDLNGTSADPRTRLLWNLDAFDLGLCKSDPITITDVTLPASAIVITSSTTTSNLPVTSLTTTLSSTPGNPPVPEEFCSMLLNIAPEQEGPLGMTVIPTLLQRGEELLVSDAPEGILCVRDASGRLITSMRTGGSTTISLPSATWAPGLHLLQLIGSDGSVRAARVMVQ
jgi:hypothetical protein